MPKFITDSFGATRYASQTLPKTDDTGTVDTAGTTVTKDTGDNFDTTWKSGTPMEINSVWYTISSITSTTELELTSSAGSQSGVAWTVRTCGGISRGGFVTINPAVWVGTAFEVFPVFRCAEDNAVYTGNTSISSFSGDGTITVTMGSDISGDLAEGYQVDIPDANGYVAGGWYVAYGISGSTFKIDGTNLGSYVGGMNLDAVDQRWEHPTFTKGSAKPGSCTDEHWFWDTDETENDLYWCAGGAWTKRREGNTNASNFAAVDFEPNAAKYWLWGLEVTHHPTPQEGSGHPTDWDGGNVTSNQGQINELVYIDTGTSNIVLEQCYIHSRDYPSRLGRGVYIGGTGPFGIIDSTISNMVDWIWDRGSQTDGTNAINISTGSQILIKNNFIQAAGISLFVTNRDIDGQIDLPQDITIERNEFDKKESWRRTTGDINYENRHHIETKAGRRVRVYGNFFDYQWGGGANSGATMTPYQPSQALAGSVSISSFTNGTIDVSGGNHFLLPNDVVYISGAGGNHDGLWEVASLTDYDTFVLANPPTGSGSAGTVVLRGPAADVTDWYAGYNLVHEGTDFIVIDGDNRAEVQLDLLGPVQIEHNVIVDMNVDSYATGGHFDVNALWADGYTGCRFVAGMQQVRDVTVQHNALYGCWGNNTTMLTFSLNNEPISGLDFSNNLFRENEGGATDNFVRIVTSTIGTAALNAAVLGGQGWTSDNNVICCNWSSVSGDYPASYLWPATEAAVNWFTPQITEGFDFHLQHDSPYISGGSDPATDGLDIGADIDAVEVARGVVSNIRVRSITSNSAIISYLAPDSDACTVEYSTSATWGTGSREADGGGDRVRNVSLSSLSTGTLYHYRVLCAAEQPSGSFVTP
jgi:hypothetical protein